MKRKYTAILSMAFTAIFTVNAMAQSRLVPARETLENLGFTAQWDAESKTAVFGNDVYTVSVSAGSESFDVNGKKVTFSNAVYEKDGSAYNVPVIIDGSFYLPDEELAQAIGAEVVDGTVVYVMPDDTAEEAAIPAPTASLSFDAQRLSDIEGISNARQLGGYVNTEGRKIKQNVIIRTGAPGAGTENDLKLLSEKYHVSDMVDFRTEGEVAAVPEPTVEGAANHSLPLNISGNMRELATEEFIEAYKKAIASGDAAQNKLLIAQNGMSPTPQMYSYFLGDEYAKYCKEFFDILLNKPEGSSVLFHCSQGKDRTGVSSALLLYAMDFDDDIIMADYMLTNEANAKIISETAESVKKYTDDPELIEKVRLIDGVSPELLQSVIDKMNAQYGSPKGYLKTRLGLTDDDFAKLKEIYLEPAAE